VSGVPHLTYRVKGVDNLFKDKEHVFYYESIEEAIELARFLLNKNKNELNEFGENASKYVKANFSEYTRYLKMINLIKENFLTDR
jgi:spore maturation protein CgeB